MIGRAGGEFAFLTLELGTSFRDQIIDEAARPWLDLGHQPVDLARRRIEAHENHFAVFQPPRDAPARQSVEHAEKRRGQVYPPFVVDIEDPATRRLFVRGDPRRGSRLLNPGRGRSVCKTRVASFVAGFLNQDVADVLIAFPQKPGDGAS